MANNQEQHTALIIDMGKKRSTCLVVIGTGDIPLPFPTSVLKAHNLKNGDRFRWTPTEDGTISPAHIEPIKEDKRIPSPEELNFDYEAIRKLGNR